MGQRRDVISRPALLPTVVTGIAAGLIASWVKSQDEPLLQKAAEALAPPSPAQKQLPAADPANADTMPPTLVAAAAIRAVTGEPATKKQKSVGQQLLHYGTGTSLALGYVLTARRWPAVATGFGTLAGVAMFLGTHASSVPLLRVQPKPTVLPTSWWLWEAGSHVMFAANVELLRRLAVRFS